MRISFLAPYRTLLSGMNDTSESIARDQSQLSSGQAVTRPSQDVAQSSTILATRRELARRQQYGKNAAGAVALIGSSLNATAKIQDMLSQVTTLAVRARSALGTTAMQGVTAEIDAFLAPVLDACNAQDNGRYLFGGFRSAAPPFTAVTGLLRGGSRGIVGVVYAGDGETPACAVSQTLTLGVGVPGPLLSAPGGADLCNTLIALRDATAAGDDAGVAAAETRLAAHEEALARVQVRLGAAQAAATAADEEHQRMGLELTGRLSTLQDADVAAVSVNLGKQQAVYQAALQAFSKMKASNLFDFI